MPLGILISSENGNVVSWKHFHCFPVHLLSPKMYKMNENSLYDHETYNIYIYIVFTSIVYIYIYIYGSVLVNEMPKSARYHIGRANSIVFTSKRLPLQPVSSERNHQVADKFRKVSCLNVYGRKRGRVGVKQCMHSFHSLDCLLSVFSGDYMSKLFPIFYLANFVCFYPSKYKAFPPNINYIFLILPYTK